MNDNELDDLFQSNADYLADQPPRDFDKDAFWQHMQPAIPQKTDRKKPRVWIWTAAAVLMAGMFGGMWWIQSQESGLEDQKLAKTYQGTSPTYPVEPSPEPVSVSPQIHVEGTPKQHRSRSENSEQIARVPQEITQSVSPQNSNSSVEKRIPRMPEKPGQQVPLRSLSPETEPVIIAIKEHSPPELIVESTKPLLEITTPIDPEKLHYRVVHINEIRERKQQEAKARTRMAFRIGVPSGTRLTTQSDREAPLSISIQN